MPSTNSLCCYVCCGDPSKCLQQIRCAATYAGGPLKIPSKNSLRCYVCWGDPSKCLQQIRCAAMYAVGILKNAFNKFVVLLCMLWGPSKIPLTMCCYFAAILKGNYHVQLIAIRAVRCTLKPEPQILSASGCVYEVGTPAILIFPYICPLKQGPLKKPQKSLNKAFTNG